MVANSLKSGYGLMQSFEFAGRQLPGPAGLEIRRMLREANLGMSAEEALNALGDRIDSKDMDMVLTAINIQRAVGGNLAEILETRGLHHARARADPRRNRHAHVSAEDDGNRHRRAAGLHVRRVHGDQPGLHEPAVHGPRPARIIMGAAIVLEILGYFAIKRIMAIEV